MGNLTEEQFENWVTALESGDYSKTTGTMVITTKEGDLVYCALGVLLDVEKAWPEDPTEIAKGYAHPDTLYREIRKILGNNPKFLENDSDLVTLVYQKSDQSGSFEPVANWLKKRRHLFIRDKHQEGEE